MKYYFIQFRDDFVATKLKVEILYVL